MSIRIAYRRVLPMSIRIAYRRVLPMSIQIAYRRFLPMSIQIAYRRVLGTIPLWGFHDLVRSCSREGPDVIDFSI